MEHLEQLWNTDGAAMEHWSSNGVLGIRVELVLSNCCRCDASEAAGFVSGGVSGGVRLLLCSLLILSSVSSRLLNALAFMAVTAIYFTKSKFRSNYC
jgi:hypothetical protein